MARLFTNDPDIARVSIPILKYEDSGDGAVYVYGKATDSTLDRDDQIIDPEFAAKSLAHWFESGANVRVMHSPALYPAGKGVELVSGDDGQYLKSRIVEPTAIKLVKEGVLSAYSVGISQPRIVRDQVAKRGRVVGGETVEVSLVDRPANPSCGIILAKMAGGAIELTEQDFIGDEPSITVGDNKFTPADFADLLVKLGKGKLTSSERSDIPKSDFAYVDSEGNGHLPVHDESHIRNAVSRFDQTDFESASARKSAARKIVSRARSHGIDVAEDTDVARAAKIAESDLDKADSNSKKDCPKCSKKFNADTDKTHCDKCGTKLPGASSKSTDADLEKAVSVVDGIPYALKQIHDATCAAYSWIDVKALYPDLEKNGIAAALGPSAMNLLYRMLEHEIQEDAGTGRESKDIGHLAKAYAMLGIFLDDEAMEPHVLAEARADLHKSFMGANPVEMSPSPMTPMGGTQNPSPTRFVRPYISGGHASDTAKAGQHPRIPGSSHVPNADAFDRGLLTSGHQADAPLNDGGNSKTPQQSHAMTTPTKAPGESKAVVGDLLKGSVRERAQAVLIQMHDAVADAYPAHCIMIPHATDIAHQPLADTTADLDNRDKNVPTPTKGVEADLVKMFDTDIVKAAIGDLIEARFAQERTEYEEKIEKQSTQLADLEARYNELAAQPDPQQAPFRGMTGIEQLLGKRSQDTRDEVTEREHKVQQYARWLESPDPAQREAARSLLTKMAR
jgi:phage head maturation protease/ribosomal protein S27AE